MPTKLGKKTMSNYHRLWSHDDCLAGWYGKGVTPEVEEADEVTYICDDVSSGWALLGSSRCTTHGFANIQRNLRRGAQSTLGAHRDLRPVTSGRGSFDDVVVVSRKDWDALNSRLLALESFVRAGQVTEQRRGRAPARLSSAIENVKRVARDVFGTAVVSLEEDELTDDGWSIRVLIGQDIAESIIQKRRDWFNRISRDFDALLPGDLVLEME